MRFIILMALFLNILDAQPREALLIGNSNYKYISDLDNPLVNLKRLKRTLKDLNFNVEIKKDLNSEDLAHAVDIFASRLAKSRDTIGFLYYTGHGCQVDYQGYLVPTNVNTKVKRKIKYNALNINEMLEAFESAGNRVNMVFLDACRDVPTGTKGGTKGLGQPTATPIGSLVVYATGAGQVAEDNSDFIDALITNIKTSDYILNVADNIAHAVAKKTNYAQIPKVFSNLPPKIVLKGGSILKPTPQPTFTPKVNTLKGISKVDGLMYQNQLLTKEDDKNYYDDKSSGRVQAWKGAIKYCQDLTLGGYTNWRLPKRDELRKLVTKTKHKTASGHDRYMRAEFSKNLQQGSYFWTSEEKDSSYAWLVRFDDGGDGWRNKTNFNYALCVR